MTRPSTRAVRRAAADLSDQVSPHLSSAKDTLVTDVLPKMKSTGADMLPKAKAAGVGVAVRAHLMEPPKKRHPWRKAAIAGGVALGAYAAWNAWRLPHASDDWSHADSAADRAADRNRPADQPGREDRQRADIPGVPADTRMGF